MEFKCIAIGNRIMGDDSIGIMVLEQLSQSLMKDNVGVIIGETDTDYVLTQINDGDYLIILDATCFGITPGTVTITLIEKAYEYKRQIYSQHQPSLIHLLKQYRKYNNGYIIGVEIEQIEYSLDISQSLREKFNYICEEIHKLIYKLISSNNR